MKIGFIGLGKLGLPVALAMESRGHRVIGCDPSPEVHQIISDRKLKYHEEGAQDLLNTTKIMVVPMPEAVAFADIIFVAVQTPHEHRFEGVTPLTDERRDFDYSFLKQAVEQVNHECWQQSRRPLLVIISTVLPGTIRREILPLLIPEMREWLVYNPAFIAMGTTIQDFLNPEFVLMGGDNKDATGELWRFYLSINCGPIFPTTIENAELIKVAYNCFISLKIVFANTLMEICHKTENANVDEVTTAIGMATNRLISTKYLRGGMGDGGGCHPRDNIAMSWLARELPLSCDLFGSLMQMREAQTKWLAGLIERTAHQHKLPVVLLGEAFKANTNITTGSPARLLLRQLLSMGCAPHVFDPLTGAGICDYDVVKRFPAVFVITTRHDCWKEMHFPPASVVIDPWRYLEKQDGVEYIGVGA